MAASNSPLAHARRHVLEVLAAIKRATACQQGRWETTSTVYEPHPDGPSHNSIRRDRLAHEYPEAQVEQWQALDAYLIVLISRAEQSRQYARAMVDHLRAQDS